MPEKVRDYYKKKGHLTDDMILMLMALNACFYRNGKFAGIGGSALTHWNTHWKPKVLELLAESIEHHKMHKIKEASFEDEDSDYEHGSLDK